MKTSTVLPAPRAARWQSGYTLVELMVALAIALFLLGGLFTIVQGTRTTYGNQSQLAQLQDNERLAMTLITDVIQAAGYFPDPQINTAAASLPAVGTTFQAGQAISGQRNAAAPEDSITVRYTTKDNDGMINCTGTFNTTGAPAQYLNTFSITNTGPNNSPQLVCTLSVNGVANPAAALVNGVQNLQIWYGVKRDFTVDNNNVDTYLRADQMSNADWTNLTAVRVILTFTNPLAGQPGQPPTVVFERVIDIMNRAGVKT